LCTILTDNLSKISYFLFGKPDAGGLIGPRQCFLFFILLLNALTLNHFAFHGFIFFDYSGFLDASWRVYRGQVPYRDFIYTVGPIHLYMNAFFFFLFGFGKTAILAHLITVSTLVIGATFAITYRRLPFIFCLLSTLLSCVGFYWWFPHPWYDQSAFFWMILSVSLLLSFQFSEVTKKSCAASLVCGIFCSLSLMTKTNIGGSFLLICLLYLASFKSIRTLAAFAIGLAIGFVFVWILIKSPALLIDNVFLNYGVGATRQLARFLVFETFLKNGYWIPALVALLNCFYFLKSNFRFLFLFFGITVVAIFSLNTGSLREPANIALFGILTAVAFRLFYDARNLYQSVISKTIYGASIAILITASIWQILFTADYSFKRANGFFRFYPLSAKTIASGPLAGWRFNHDDDAVFNDILIYVNQNISKRDSFLILTDLQILYPLTGHNSYQGVPFLFSVDILPAPGKQLKSVQKAIANNRPDWILTHRDSNVPYINDLIRYLELQDFLLTNYQLVNHWGRYGLFKRINS